MALVLRSQSTRSYLTSSFTPLNVVRPTRTSPFRYILSLTDVTSPIRAALHLHPDPAYLVSDFSVRSTRAGGAMLALLCGVDTVTASGSSAAGVPTKCIASYLHIQAQPVMQGLSAAMLRGGSFRLTPG